MSVRRESHRESGTYNRHVVQSNYSQRNITTFFYLTHRNLPTNLEQLSPDSILHTYMVRCFMGVQEDGKKDC